MKSATFKFSVLAKFPEIVHGISTRTYGNMNLYRGDQNMTIKNRQHFLSEMNVDPGEIIVPEMIHGTKIIAVSEGERGRGAKEIDSDIKGADGLITDKKNLFLLVTAADCLPILAYDPATQIVAAVHCGWRGIIGGIVDELINKFRHFGSEEENIIIGIGPGICQKHFTVKKDVWEQFLKNYPQAVLLRNKHGYVDLKKVILLDLKKNGLQTQNIEVAKLCPTCQSGIFGSYRLEKDQAPTSAAVIGIRG